MLVPLALVALVAAGCRGEEEPVRETEPVVRGEVVETIAAAATLEPANRVTVTAPAAGVVEQVLVADGDRVAAGDPLVRISSEAIEQQVEQATAALEASEAFAATAAQGGVDVAPIVGAFRAQLDALFPPLLAALQGQVDALEIAARQAAAAVPDAVVVDPGGGLGDVLDGELQIPLPSVELGPLEAALADARRSLAETEAGYREARASLVATERDLGRQAEAAAAAQRAVVVAQRDQAERALVAARARIEGLTVLAPVAGVVELARGGTAGGGGVGDALSGLGGLGGLGDVAGGLVPGPAAPTAAGPLVAGVGVGIGQELVTIFDLSGFTAQVEVDEVDAVSVEVGQPAVVLVDAFPDASIDGVVTHVAIAPRRLPTGGIVYPVTVELRSIPDGVRLRVGATASAEIEVSRVRSATVVPTAALLRRGSDEVVHVVREGIVRRVPVIVEAIGEDTAAVLGALAAGDRVVTVGVESVQDGDRLEVEAGG
jgi:HlyD family secretion protein